MIDFQNWIESKFGRWTYRELFISAVVLVTCVLLFGVVRPGGGFPAQSQFDPDALTAVKRWLGRDDPRGFRPPGALSASGIEEEDIYDVAWISGSPISVRQVPAEWRLVGKSSYEMTDVLARYLVAMDGMPIRVQEYLLQGVRTGDMRRAVLYASAQPAIDAYIVELNPVWLLNEYLMFTISNQRAMILGMDNANWFDWSVALRLLSPHEIGFELAGRLVPRIRDRYDFFGQVSLGKSPSFPFSATPRAAQDGEMMALWQKWFRPDIASLPVPTEAESLTGYRNLTLMGNTADDAIGIRFFVENVKTLAATKKPVLMFIPPLNPAMKNDAFLEAYVQDMTRAVETAFSLMDAPNVSLRTDSVWVDAQPSQYKDALHTNHAQGIIDLVVDMLEGVTGQEFTKRPHYQVYGES